MFVSPDYSDFHQSFVRELASANFTELEVVLDSYLPPGFALSAGDLTPSALAYWAWVAGVFLRRGFLIQAERVLEIAGQACIKMAIDKISCDLLLCDLRSQLLRHISQPCELSEKNMSSFFGELQEIAQVDEAHLFGTYTLLELSLVYEKTADFERAFNLFERACLMASRCEAIPEQLQSWIDRKNELLRPW